MDDNNPTVCECGHEWDDHGPHGCYACECTDWRRAEEGPHA